MGSCLAKPAKEVPTAVVPSDVVRGQPVVRLFGSALCPFTSRIQIALQYKRVNVQAEWLTAADLAGNNKLDFLASINPDVKLPILQYGLDTVFGCSDTILQYIETKFPNPRLVPDGPMADITLDWVVYVRDIFTPLIGQILYDGNPFVQRELLPKLESSFTRLNGGIMEYSNRGPYFFGNNFSLVDVYLIPFLYLIFPLQHFRGVEISEAHSYLQSYGRQMLTFPCYSPIRLDLDLLHKSVARTLAERAPPPLLAMTILQHKSILCHMEKLVHCADELAVAKQQGFKAIDPTKGSIGMQIKKLLKSYAQLVDLMQEHAQMEERIIFPALEKADRGITKIANEEHARDLPVMNGIREDIKSVTVLEAGSPDRSEALLRVSVRLRTLQAHCMEHFQEEEQGLLPLLEAADLGSKQQEALLGSCFGVMELSHSQLFAYMLSGLRPHEIQQYLEIAQRCQEQDKILRMIQSLRSSDGESKTALTVVQKRVPALSGCGDIAS
eukprot:Gb_21487 [translate_table: standard]